MITHRYSPLCPKGLKAEYSGMNKSRMEIGLFWELEGKVLLFEKGGSKIFFRIYVLSEHNPRVATAITALIV